MQYPIDRYAMETKRLLHVLDTNLARREYVIGDDYTIADIAIYTWYGAIMSSAYSAQEFLSVGEYAHVKRWMDLLEARPGVQRGRIVNRNFGDPQLAERHSAADIDAALNAGT